MSVAVAGQSIRFRGVTFSLETTQSGAYVFVSAPDHSGRFWLIDRTDKRMPSVGGPVRLALLDEYSEGAAIQSEQIPSWQPDA